MDKEQYKKFKEALSSPKATASEKLSKRDKILAAMTDKMDLDEEGQKRAKAQLDGLIKKGNFSKTGAIDPRGLVSKGLDAGVKSGSKQIAKKIGKKLLSSIPFVGAAYSAAQSQDASAAVPGLGDVESTGPKKGSQDAKLEDPSISMEERKKIYESIKKTQNKKALEASKG